MCFADVLSVRSHVWTQEQEYTFDSHIMSLKHGKIIYFF